MLRNLALFATQGVTQGYFTQTKSVVSVIQKHVTTLHIKLCDKTRNKASGCGAVGSALPWGGRGRKFKSCHSDQEKHRKQPFSVLFSFVFNGFSYFFGQTTSSIMPLTTIATTIDFLRLNKGERKFNTFLPTFDHFLNTPK